MSQHCQTFESSLKRDSMEGSLFVREDTLGMPGFKESYQLDLLALGDPALSSFVPNASFELYGGQNAEVLGVEPSYLADWCSLGVAQGAGSAASNALVGANNRLAPLASTMPIYQAQMCNTSIPYMSSHSDSFTEYFDCSPCPSFGADQPPQHPSGAIATATATTTASSSSSPRSLEGHAVALQQHGIASPGLNGQSGHSACVAAVQKSDVTNNDLAQFNTLVGEMAGSTVGGSGGSLDSFRSVAFTCGASAASTAGGAAALDGVTVPQLSACSQLSGGSQLPKGSGRSLENFRNSGGALGGATSVALTATVTNTTTTNPNGSRTPTKSADAYLSDLQHNQISLGLENTPSTTAATPTSTFLATGRMNSASLSSGASSASSTDGNKYNSASDSQDFLYNNASGNASQEQKTMEAFLSNRYIREMGVQYDEARMEAPPPQDIKVFVRKGMAGERGRSLELLEEIKTTLPLATSQELNEIIIKSGALGAMANSSLVNGNGTSAGGATNGNTGGNNNANSNAANTSATTSTGATAAAAGGSTANTFGQSYQPVISWDSNYECYDVYWYMADKTGQVTSRVCRFFPLSCGGKNGAYDEALKFSKYVESVVRPGALIQWYPGFNIPIGTNGRTNLRKVLHMDRMKNSEQCDPVLEANGLKIATKSTFGDMTIVELYKAAYVLGLWDVAAYNCLKTCKRRGYSYEWIQAIASKNKRVTLDALKYLRNVKEATISKRRAQEGYNNSRQKKKSSY